MTIVDILRIAVIVVACICMVLMAMRATRARMQLGDTFTVYATAALVTFMLFTVVVEVKQIGHPLATWYGLPMLALGSLLTLVALRKSKV